MTPEIRSRIEQLIQSNDVVLFMKGNKHFPQCGFSAQVIGILKESGVPFETVNVLQDPALRDGIKEFTEWPTIPQLYVKGEFVGGCDIVKELHASGELQKTLGVKEEPVVPPTVTLDAAAAKALREADEGGDDKLRLAIDGSFRHELFFAPANAADVVVEASGVTLRMDKATAKRAQGLAVAFVEGPEGGAFRIDNPNEPPRVRGLSVEELKGWMDAKRAFALFDVRTPEEQEKARLEGAVLLDDAGEAKLRALPKDTTLVFQCHHGMRSRAAAEKFLREGFTKVYNLDGGIDAWSQKVDPTVARY